MQFDLLIKNGILTDGRNEEVADLGVHDGVIVAQGALNAADAAKTINASGLHVLPGVIDTQVHFREPGNPQAETLATGSKAALLGGVTGVFEMPNTQPPTINAEMLADKRARAQDNMFCDYAFYAGGVGENINLLSRLEREEACCGVKVFMGSSTGSLLTSDEETLAGILAAINYPAAFHAENEARLNDRKHYALADQPETHPIWRDEETALRATQTILRLARKAKKQIHVLHITTADEIALLANNKDIASVEVTPQHLTLAAPECYQQLGTYAQMNPPIREAEHQAALWQGIKNGVVDMIGSDHAPHTKAAKALPYPQSPSGMPGVQTLLPIMLNHVHHERLSLATLVKLICINPVRRFGIRRRNGLAIGAEATLTLVDLTKHRQVEDAWIASPCGWTPFAGHRLVGWPQGVIVRGRRAMWDDEIIGKPCGKPFLFDRVAAEGDR